MSDAQWLSLAVELENRTGIDYTYFLENYDEDDMLGFLLMSNKKLKKLFKGVKP